MTSGQYIKGKFQAWAGRKGLALQGSKGIRGEPNYTLSVEENIFGRLLTTATTNAFKAGAGRELEGEIPTMSALHSSAAMAVNLFQHWVIQDDLATLARILDIPSRGIAAGQFETQLPVCPNARERGFRESPHLDFTLRYTDGQFAGIESKLFEPYGRLEHALLRPAYLALPDAWDDIPACRGLAEQLATGSAGFQRLGAPQLLKHVLALRFAASTRKVTLVYLYFDAPGNEATEHRNEIRQFQQAIVGDPVEFVPLSVQEFILRATQHAGDQHRDYLDYVSERYL